MENSLSWKCCRHSRLKPGPEDLLWPGAEVQTDRSPARKAAHCSFSARPEDSPDASRQSSPKRTAPAQEWPALQIFWPPKLPVPWQAEVVPLRTSRISPTPGAAARRHRPAECSSTWTMPQERLSTVAANFPNQIGMQTSLQRHTYADSSEMNSFRHNGPLETLLPKLLGSNSVAFLILGMVAELNNKY